VLGNILGGGIELHDIDGFRHILKDGYQRVIAVQNHPMVQILVDPTLKDPFDISEIQDHAKFVKRVCFKSYKKSAIVAVKIPAFAFVVE